MPKIRSRPRKKSREQLTSKCLHRHLMKYVCAVQSGDLSRRTTYFERRTAEMIKLQISYHQHPTHTNTHTHISNKYQYRSCSNKNEDAVRGVIYVYLFASTCTGMNMHIGAYKGHILCFHHSLFANVYRYVIIELVIWREKGTRSSQFIYIITTSGTTYIAYRVVHLVAS